MEIILYIGAIGAFFNACLQTYWFYHTEFKRRDK